MSCVYLSEVTVAQVPNLLPPGARDARDRAGHARYLALAGSFAERLFTSPDVAIAGAVGYIRGSVFPCCRSAVNCGVGGRDRVRS